MASRSTKESRGKKLELPRGRKMYDPYTKKESQAGGKKPERKSNKGYTPKGKPGTVTGEQGKYGRKQSRADLLKKRKKSPGAQ